VLITLVLVAFVPMIMEAVRSARNDRALRAAGAIEPTRDVFASMQLAYPGVFVLMIAESWLRGRTFSQAAAAGFILFGAAKALKYWAIATLGPRWTFRVLVPPESRRTIAGPYKYLRHPNYVAVVGEIAGFGLAAQTPLTAMLALIVFVPLIVQRVRIEEQALGLRR
jgi:methyltransferase